MVGDSEGYIHIINSATGEIEGREKVGDVFLSQPVTRGQTAWIQTLDGDVIAWQLSE